MTKNSVGQNPQWARLLGFTFLFIDTATSFPKDWNSGWVFTHSFFELRQLKVGKCRGIVKKESE